MMRKRTHQENDCIKMDIFVKCIINSVFVFITDVQRIRKKLSSPKKEMLKI